MYICIYSHRETSRVTNKQQCSVHNSCSVQHRGHKNVVSWTIHKWHVPLQVHRSLFTLKFIVCGTTTGDIWTKACGGWAMVDFGIRVTQFNCNISFQFIFESNRVDPRNGFDNGRFSVCDMTDYTNIDSCLSANDFWREWRELRNCLQTIRVV